MIGVYYLTDGLDVIYVGASLNVERRIREHQAQGQIDFSQVFVDACEPHCLRDREASAIQEFRPILNEHATPNKSVSRIVAHIN